MRRALSFGHRALRRLLLTALVLAALINGLAFLLTPLLDLYRSELTALASERLGIPLSIGGMKARWRGYGPELALKDLQIGDPDRPGSIQLADAAVDFGLWDMLRYRDISPLRITLRNLEIHLIRDPAGRLRLAGFEALQNGQLGDAGAVAGKLPLSGRLRLEDATVLWEDQRLQLPVRRLEHAQLRLHVWPGQLVMAASIQLPGSAPGRLHAAAELSFHGQDWDGGIYLQADMPEAAAQLGPYLPAGLRVSRGGIALAAWSDWENSRLSSLEGHLSIAQLRLDRGPDTPVLDIDQASSNIRYRREGERRHIDLSGLTLKRAGHSWPASQLYLLLDLSPEGHPELQLAADRLRLGDLLAMTRPLPLPAELAALREQLAADAVLHDLRFRMEPGSGPPRWQLSSDFGDLGTRAWGNYPGVQGLAGRLRANPHQATLTVSTAYSQIDLPTLFREPLPVRRLEGKLTLQREDDGWQLHSDELLFDTPDIDTRSRLTLSKQGGEGLQIDLQTNFGNGESTFAERYYPAHIMHTELLEWLDRAIGPGLVPRGTLLLRGPLDDFPYDQTHNGHFEVRFDVADLQLDYLPDWPALTISDAEVRFHNNSLAIQLRDGSIYDSDVLPTEAHIRSLNPTGPLEIKGALQGPLGDPVRLLAETPLKARFGELAGGLQAEGSSRLALDFAVVLSTIGKERLDGELQLQQAGLALPAWNLALSDAEGSLHFDLNGVHARDVRAKALGRPVRIDVRPTGDGALVHADTRIGIPTLIKRFPDAAAQLPKNLFSGEAALAVDVNIPRKPGPDNRQTLRLSSDLAGIAVKLPAPIGKTAKQVRPLKVEIPLNGGEDSIRLSYADLLNAAFRPGGDRLAIHFGATPAQLPEQAVLRLSGRLDELALDPWLQLGDSGKAATQLPPLRADLELGRLRFGEIEQHDVRLQLAQNPDSWQGAVHARQLEGSFNIPAKPGQRPIGIDLERLQLTLDPDKPPGTATDPGQPGDWPELNLNIVHLLINEADFGQLSVQARQSPEGLRLLPIRLQGPQLSFVGEGLWQSGAQNGTRLSGELSTPRLGSVLSALGYTSQFSGARTTADFDFNWPGKPSDFELARLQGTLNLNIEDGQLLEVNPGVARVFGLLNFRALQRRLRLDFSDLFEKGLAFDSIRGRFRLVDGNAYTSNLTLKGPTGTVLITGRTGLAARDLYQEITVDPKLDATLPVAGALAGGPLAGVAVFVAQTLMKDKVQDINRTHYRVSGSWDDPKIEKTKGGDDLSGLFRPEAEPAAAPQTAQPPASEVR